MRSASVVIPTFNRAHLIHRAIESAINQTYPCEVILCDHGSTDKTPEIAEKLGLSRGTVVHHLAKLMDSGIVLREREGYILRESNMQDLIKDLHHDMERMFSELKDVAKEIDLKLG